MNPDQLYARDGYYVHVEPLISAAKVQAASAGMDAVRHGQYDTGRPPMASPWNPGDDEGILCKIEMPQMASRAIADLVADEELGRWAARVAGAQWVQVWWVQLLYKPPSLAGAAQVNVGWHQDRTYWGTWEEGSELFTAWVALSDVGGESGPMSFVPGSHRWGLLPGGDFFAQDLESLRQAIELPEGGTWREEQALMAAGGASFHDCLTLHGSGANTSPAPRRSFAIHMRTEKSRPRNDRREGLSQFIDDFSLCPVIYQ